MPRTIPLTAVKGGINRLRLKGAARADLLFELLNGYVTSAKTVKVRPGTARVADVGSDFATHGLTAHGEVLHVFTDNAVGTLPAGFESHVLIHPETDNESSDYDLKEIHFAQPFMQFLYVVAEFENGDIYHYWLQTSGPWEPETVYRSGDMIEPTTPNGLAYQATRLDSPKLSWAPGVPRADGDEVEPTVYNDFYYVVVETVGANPVSGTREPEWPTDAGARVIEDTATDAGGAPGTTPPPDNQVLPRYMTDRYFRGE
jgi:hypothetical protein